MYLTERYGYGMTELVIGVSMQPDFPREDLTDTNADLLEFMMSNRDIVVAGHQAAERVVWSFKVGHVAISRSTPKVYDDFDWQSAIDHGTTTFEAIAAMVGGGIGRVDSFPIHTQAVALMNLPTSDLRRHCEEAVGKFQSNAPRTAEVVRVSSSRYHGVLSAYAVLGAAMSWQFERDIDS